MCAKTNESFKNKLLKNTEITKIMAAFFKKGFEHF